MATLWAQGEGTVREVLGRLGQELAYTTVMTVLDRLHHKGQVHRRKEGVAWCYSAAAPQEAVLGKKAAALINQPGVEPGPLLMAFLDHTEAVDPAMLDQLERLIRQKRKARGGGR